jgi:MinD superfamily P-loop ATPase
MKELVIISGKGGTGKTSVTASFAALAGNAVLVDCDVDAADLHLLLKPEIKFRHEFKSGNEAVIRADYCKHCCVCREVCRFEAIKSIDGKIIIDPFACEGCGVCVWFCPEQVIDFPESICGEWYESETRCGTMIHARLAPAAENSGKLVTQVRRAAREMAEKQGKELLLVDGPPGIGCPVIASVTGATAVLIVTEPTVSGEHDLERVLKLTRHFKIPALVCVNKWDLNPDITKRIEDRAIATGAKVVERIPYDKIFTDAMINGRLVVDYPETMAAKSITKIWEHICQEM